MVHVFILNCLLNAADASALVNLKIDYPPSCPSILGLHVPRVKVVVSLPVVYPIGRFLVAGDKKTDGGWLVNLITGCVKPRSWWEMGGTGRIRYNALQSTVVVVNEPEVHEMIVELLADLDKLLQQRGPLWKW